MLIIKGGAPYIIYSFKGFKQIRVTLFINKMCYSPVFNTQVLCHFLLKNDTTEYHNPDITNYCCFQYTGVMPVFLMTNIIKQA